MKINEIEEQLQLSRANIRFYEKEGFLSPKRGDNGYRDYGDEDIAVLKKIIIFRKLGLSLNDIHLILEGSLELSEALERNIIHLNQQIAELNGALGVCKIMQKEVSLSETFDEEHYWELIQTREQNGEKFVELVKDYLEFEKRSFFTMWENTFFFPLGHTVKKHGWKFMFGILFLICIVRGIVQELFIEWGSFFSGFCYPFFLFGLITVVTFPLFILQRKYKNAEPEEPKDYKHPYLIGTLKWLGAILYVFTFFLGTPILMESVVNQYFKNTVYVATYDMFLLYWIMGIYVLFMLVYLYSKHGLFPTTGDQKEGLHANLPRKIKRKVCILSFLVLFVSLLLSISWYDRFTEKGITIRRWIYTTDYSWKDADYYTLSAGLDGTLTYSVVMKDDTKADCIGGGSVLSTANLSEEMESDYDFVKHLSEILARQGVELRVDDWDKLYDDLDYESWIELAEDIREIAEAQ